MREIKFRAWDGELMHDVGELHFSQGPKLDGKGIRFFGQGVGSGWVDGENVVLMQYTGLKDKNGKESYHKDIVEFEGFLYSIEWDEKRTGFYLADLVYLDDPDSEEHKIGSCISESVIKGNPWEHPHLLEVGYGPTGQYLIHESEYEVVEGRESIPKEDTK